MNRCMYLQRLKEPVYLLCQQLVTGSIADGITGGVTGNNDIASTAPGSDASGSKQVVRQRLVVHGLGDDPQLGLLDLEAALLDRVLHHDPGTDDLGELALTVGPADGLELDTGVPVGGGDVDAICDL